VKRFQALSTSTQKSGVFFISAILRFRLSAPTGFASVPRGMPKGKKAAPVEIEDEEILAILKRKREVAVRTAEATRRLHDRNKVENLRTRLHYAKVEADRIADYKRRLAENHQKHVEMYSHSPFRHDVGVHYFKVVEKKEKEAALEREYQKIYKRLEAMTGTPKIDLLKLSNKDVLDKVTSDPLSKEELVRRKNRLDARELQKELSFLDGMVDRCLDDTRKKFPNVPFGKDDANVAIPNLNPFKEHTKFIRNDPAYVDAAAEERM